MCSQGSPICSSCTWRRGAPCRRSPVHTWHIQLGSRSSSLWERQKKILRTFLGALRLGLVGWVSLFWRPPMYLCGSLLAAAPSLAVSSRMFVQLGLALERQGESVELPGVHQDSPSPSLCKPSWHTALLGVTASGAPRRKPSASFLPSIPLC